MSNGDSTPPNDALPIYRTVAATEATTVPSCYSVLRTIGYHVEDDGGGAYYRRTGTMPRYHQLWFQDQSGSYWELDPADGIWNVRQCGARGDGVTDDTTSLQRALDFAMVYEIPPPDKSVYPLRRRPKLLIPAGNYKHYSLTIQDIQRIESEPKPSALNTQNSGYITIEGDGPANTALVCADDSGSAIQITSGFVTIRSLHITSNPIFRSKTKGEGDGICVQPDVPPGTQPQSDITRVVLEDLTIDQQPGNGISLFQIEQFEINRVFSCDNGRNGLVETVPFPDVGITVGCQIRSCRFANNGEAGLDVKLHNSTFINVETLSNEGDVQFNIEGDRNTIINPDVEIKKNPDAENSDVEQGTGDGLVLGGDLNTVIGGIFNGIEGAAVQVYGNSATILNPGIRPGTKGVGIRIKDDTTGHHIRVCLPAPSKNPKDPPPGPMFKQGFPDPGSTYSYVTTEGTGYILQGALRSYPGIGSAVTPLNDGELCFEATANDTVTIRLLGSDGTIRNTTLTLS